MYSHMNVYQINFKTQIALINFMTIKNMLILNIQIILLLL